jgi:hypothetical protein
VHHLVAHDDLTCDGTMYTGQCLDQGRLTCSVLAEQRMDLTGQQAHRDVVERPDAGERHADPAHLDGRSTLLELLAAGRIWLARVGQHRVIPTARTAPEPGVSDAGPGH